MSQHDIDAERSRLALQRPDLLREAAYIDGDWVGGEDRIAVHNPATGRALGSVPNLGGAAAERATAAAHAALPAWRAKSG
jgi:succinate-semialdehyde dehydrogenase/glutarate-semialdehyde dehydrogenase